MAIKTQTQTTTTLDQQAQSVNLQQGFPVSEHMGRLKRQKDSARKFQKRRREDWDDNYDLQRNKVFTNRLTQRQTVNIPLMKETIKTIMSKIDDPPAVDWKEKSGDLNKQLVLQEIWNDYYDRLNFEAIDLQDKKTVLLYGRAFKKFNWTENGLDVRALDIYDVLVDPLTDPLDLETARFVIHQNIFRTVHEIMEDERYDDQAKERLKSYLNDSVKEAVAQSDKAKQEWERKMERIQDMGMDKSDFASFAGGDVIVNLTEHYSNQWNKEKGKYEKYVTVYANDSVELLHEKLMDLLGVDFYPFVTWADDMETQDFWSDSIADLVRTPNKILNVWFSQLIENRTLRNFQMNWYDSTVQGYVAQTYEPGPGRMLPAPGDPNKTIMPVAIDGLDETMNSINFITQIVERATNASATDKGIMPQKQVRKAEIQAILAKAQERTITMMKFYRRSWTDFALKWLAIIEANESGKLVLHKVSRSGKIWPKSVYPNDWKSKYGFKPYVRSTSEQESEKNKGIQKVMFALQQFPNNNALKIIGQKRIMQMLDLTPEEMRQVEEEEKKAQQQTPPPQLAGQPQQPGQSQPTQPKSVAAGGGQDQSDQAMSRIARRVQQIKQMTV